MGEKTILPEEKELGTKIRRGIYARRAISSGEAIESEMLIVRRPGAEIPADAFDGVVGKRPQKDIAAQAPLSWADLS